MAEYDITRIKSPTNDIYNIKDNTTGPESIQTTGNEFLYRQSPLSYPSGSATLDSIKGNTVSFNQLVQPATGNAQTTNGITFTPNGDGSITVSGSASGGNAIFYCPNSVLIANHKYYGKGCPSGGNTNTYSISFRDNSASVVLGNDEGSGILFTPTQNYSAGSTLIRIVSGTSFSSAVKFYPQIFDLTLMSIDNLTTVVEVEEWLSTHIGNLPYYNYTQGTLIPFMGSGLKTTGKNLLKSQSVGTFSGVTLTENNGTYTLNGSSSGYQQAISSTTFMLQKGTYTLYINRSTSSTVGVQIRSTDGVTTYGDSSSGPSTFTLTEKTEVKFRIVLNAGTFNNVQISPQLEFGSTATGFEPYVSNTLSLPTLTYFPSGMKSAGSVYDELSDKAYTRIGSVDMGTLDWRYDSPTMYVSVSNISNIKLPVSDAVAISGISPIASAIPANNRGTASGPVFYTYIGFLYFRNTGYTDATAFKQAMADQNVKLFYELATPTETDISPELDLSVLEWKGGTEQVLPINTSTPSTSPLKADISYNNFIKTVQNELLKESGGGGESKYESFYGTCTTAADQQVKTVTISNTTGWELRAGTIIGVKFSNTNTYNSTSENPVKLNVNSTGNKNVYWNNTLSPTGTNTDAYGYANRINYYMYDGTNWMWISKGLDGNDHTVSQTATTTNADYEVLFSNTADNTTRTEGTRKNSNLKFNPSTGTLQTTILDSGLQSTDINIANGDKIVVTDASNSNKVARTSLSFDGTSDDQYLSKKGTWESNDYISKYTNTTDNEFLYRQSPTPYDNGTGTITSIKGNTVSFNQLVQNGNFADSSGWIAPFDRGTLVTSNNVLEYTVVVLGSQDNGNRTQQTGKDLKIVYGHKYYFTFSYKSSVSGNSHIRLTDDISNPTQSFPTVLNVWNKNSYIFIGASDIQVWIYPTLENLSIGDKYYLKDIMCFDLTLMGIDNLTTTTEVESWLSSHIGNLPYFDYTQGTLIPFMGTGLKTTGKNLLPFDIATLKSLNTTGTWNDNVYTLNNLTFTVADGTITINGTSSAGTTFYLLSNGNERFKGTFVISGQSGFASGTSAMTYVFADSTQLDVYATDQTRTKDTYLVSAHIYVWNNKTFNNLVVKPMIRFSDADATFEPYQSNTLSLPTSTYFPTGMNYLSRNGNTVYDLLTNAKAYTRTKEAWLSDMTWVKVDGYNNLFVSYSITDIKQYTSANTNIKTGKYLTQASSDILAGIGISSYSTSDGYAIAINDPAYSTLETFTASLVGQRMVYELATPTETDISLDLTYPIWNGGTEQIIPVNTSIPITTPIKADITYNNFVKAVADSGIIELGTVGDLAGYNATTLVSGVDPIEIGVDMDLLWTNSAPTSDFAAQTVVLDLTNYSMCIIQFFEGKNNRDNITNQIVRKDGINTYCNYSFSNIRYRFSAMNSSGITFGDCKNYGSYNSSASTLNSAMIPYQIYGIK